MVHRQTPQISADNLGLFRLAAGRDAGSAEARDPLLWQIELSPEGEKLVERRQLRLANGREALFLRRRQQETAGRLFDVGHLAGQVDRWPVIEHCDIAIVQDPSGWRISVAPSSGLDLFAASDPDGSLILADLAAAVSRAIGQPSELDLDAIADRYNGWLRHDGLRTVRCGVIRIVGGHEFRAANGALEVRRWWEPAKVTLLCHASVKTMAARLRSLATEIAIRHMPESGPVAVQLSGGRDSSILCAIVATHLAGSGRTVHAMTALPCAGLATANERHQFDESEGAIATASRFANVEHHLLRPQPVPLASVLDRLHGHIGEPIHQPVSLSWSVPQLELCRESGIETLLTGDEGNFTVSAGGLPSLSDVRCEEGIWQWLRTSVRMRSEGRVTMRDLVRISFGALLPLPLYNLARRRGQPTIPFNDHPFFKGALREQLLAMTPGNNDPRPSASDRAMVQEIAAVSTNLIPIGRFDYGVELLKPWADRALYEMMLSLPASLLASPSDRRTLFDEAFGDLLPPEVLRPARRGLQNVDLHASVDRDDIATAIERYRGSALCRELVDLERLARAAADWPTRRITEMPARAYWVNQFLPTLSLASFLYSQGESSLVA